MTAQAPSYTPRPWSAIVPPAAFAGLTAFVFFAVSILVWRRPSHPHVLGSAVIYGAVEAAIYAVTAVTLTRGLFTSSDDGQRLTEAHDPELAPILGELEVLRQDVAARIDKRMRPRFTLGLAAGAIGWSAAQIFPWPFTTFFFGLPVTVAVCAMSGWALAAGELSTQYELAYKTRVLPLLLGRLGALQWRKASPPADLGQLKAEHVLPDSTTTEADDEVYGTYRGLPVSLIELKLTRDEGKHVRTVFHGFLMRLSLPRALKGTTLIVGDTGQGTDVMDRLLQKAQRERVWLESPQFEAVYNVYASDQIAARALLTPAFMDRLIALGSRPGYHKPTALAVDNMLTIALPTCDERNLLEPPDYQKPAASLTAVATLREDIAAVLCAADAVIDLDQAARAMADEGLRSV